MRQRWTKKELNKLQSIYVKSSKEILMKAFPNRTYSSINMAASRLGLKKEETNRWTEAENLYLSQNYSDMSMAEIERNLLGRGSQGIVKQAERLGLKRLTRVEKYGEYYKFFDQIDAPEKAWCLGYFLADGHLCIKQGYISFTSIDKSLLEIVKRVIGCPQEIKAEKIRDGGFNSKQSYILKITNRYMANALQNMGFDNHKSQNAFMPKIAPELLPSLVRGLVCGDGSIMNCKDGKSKFLCLHINGTEKLLTELHELLPIKGSLKPQSGVWRITYSYRKAKQMCEWMYKDSKGLRLERKYQRYLDSLTQTGFYS